jgi:thymidine kinase
MFCIDKRSSLSLNPSEFPWDRPIHKQIVSPLPCTPFYLTITGSAGSGKTSMLVNLLTSPHAYKKEFHAVQCIIPAHSVVFVKKNIFNKHPRMHDELNFVTLDRIYEQVMRDGEEKMSILIIMDDVPACLKNLDIQMLLKKLIYNRQHYRLSIICLV